MLRRLKRLTSLTPTADDGAIGSVCDLLFDDRSWTVRYVVVDVGSWLTGRMVLLTPDVIGDIDDREETLAVRRTKQQIEDAPRIDADPPVSFRMAQDLATIGYCANAGMAPPVAVPLPPLITDENGDGEKDGDPHLRSVTEVVGYHLEACDGEIGRIVDFIVDCDDWSLPCVVVCTRVWLPGKKVLVATRVFDTIDWSARHVATRRNRDEIRNAPEFYPSTSLTPADLRALGADDDPERRG